MNNLPAPEPEVEKKAPKVIDLMEALRRSVAQRAPSAGTPTNAPPAAETPRTSDPRKKLAATGVGQDQGRWSGIPRRGFEKVQVCLAGAEDDDSGQASFP